MTTLNFFLLLAILLGTQSDTLILSIVHDDSEYFSLCRQILALAAKGQHARTKTDS
jgi:hypothetical protein